VFDAVRRAYRGSCPQTAFGELGEVVAAVVRNGIVSVLRMGIALSGTGE
jgi:hypothetical protein